MRLRRFAFHCQLSKMFVAKKGYAMTKTVSLNAIQTAIKEKYKKVSCSPNGNFKYPTGRAGAEALGYDSNLIKAAPQELIALFCGVGCPFSAGKINSEETVLDIGCGGGFDMFCASKLVGPKGKVYGLELSTEMSGKAIKNLSLAGTNNTYIQIGSSEQLPFEDNTFDVVTSNGVFNLSPEKEKTYSELFRVLKPSGRIQFADMVLKKELPPEELSTKSWSH